MNDTLEMFWVADSFGQERDRIPHTPREHAGGADVAETDFDADGKIRGHTPIAQPDWDEIYERCDGDENRLRHEVKTVAAEAMAEMVDWLQEPIVSTFTIGSETRIIRWDGDKLLRYKIHVYTLYTRPQNLGNCTMEQLANRLGISKQKLDVIWLDFCKRFGLETTWSKTDKAKNASRASHTKGIV